MSFWQNNHPSISPPVESTLTINRLKATKGDNSNSSR